jgi:hypothetical protein
VAGSCQYRPDVVASCSDGNACTVNDVCGASGVCGGTAVSCQAPPPPVCVNTQMLRSYDAVGQCGGAGICSYLSQDANCPFGCSNGVCQGNPCAGVSCTMPPANSCASDTTRRTYPASGVCTSGMCSYAPTDVPCASGEVCQVGLCKWNDASLTGLAVMPGSLTFSPSQMMYAVTVPASSASVVVTATVAQPSRTTIRINGTATASGSSATVTLTGGVTSVTLRVDAESGVSTTYTVVVTRVGSTAP